MQRRTLLKLGAAGGTALALLGGGAALLYEPGWQYDELAPAGRVVLAAVARGVLDGTLPDGEPARQSALTAHLERMNAMLRSMPAHAQGEVGQLLSVLASAPGRIGLAGLSGAWESAELSQLQSALQSMRASRLLLRRQVYHALRDLTHAAYFSDSATWRLLGYPGPAKLE